MHREWLEGACVGTSWHHDAAYLSNINTSLYGMMQKSLRGLSRLHHIWQRKQQRAMKKGSKMAQLRPTSHGFKPVDIKSRISPCLMQLLCVCNREAYEAPTYAAAPSNLPAEPHCIHTAAPYNYMTHANGSTPVYRSPRLPNNANALPRSLP